MSTADITTLQRDIVIELIGQWFLIQVVLKDGPETAVAGASEAECAKADSFQSCITKVFS
jgi:hypothetical protein